MRIYQSPPKHRRPIYRAKAAYRNMRRRAGNACGTEPSYAQVELRMTEQEWLVWALPLYETFLRDNPHESPNVSRFNDVGHYEIGNVEIISAAENRRRLAAPLLARPDGSKMCSTCRAVKRVEDFSRNRDRPDGLAHQCRVCRSVRHDQKRPS